MSTRRPWLTITTDTPHRIAFVRGLDAYRVCLDLSGDVPPIRSASGVIVNLSMVADIESLAQYRGLLVVKNERKAAAS